MPHPNRGQGNAFDVTHTFQDAFIAIGENSIQFNSTTGEQVTVTQSLAEDGVTEVLVFVGLNGRVGNVCAACWGFRKNCFGTRIGQCVEGLDMHLP
jgi:hypothetical protein